TATAALGRTLSAAALMGSIMPERDDLLTLRFKGDGNGGAIVVSSDYSGNVRGFIENPCVDLPLKATGKLDVSSCVGHGQLFVLRDTGNKQPYVGVSNIVSGEIAEDIAAYYASSEQIPTLCALGVLVDVDLSCLASGGVLIQLLPFADPQIIEKLEKNIKNLPPLTELLTKNTTENILSLYLNGIEFDVFDKIECGYVCPCNRERTEKALISLGKYELMNMIEQDGKAELSCHFCEKKYNFSRNQLIALAKEAKV
ncbi:MAG: Hsp33 family molecular chaperone HslO, partial [Clostridia bacterium]